MRFGPAEPNTICLFEILFVTPRINWRTNAFISTTGVVRGKKRRYTERLHWEHRRRRRKKNDRNDNLLHTVAILNEFQRLERTRTPERPLNCVRCKSAMLLTHSRCKDLKSPFLHSLAQLLWAIYIQTLCAVSMKALIALLTRNYGNDFHC